LKELEISTGVYYAGENQIGEAGEELSRIIGSRFPNLTVLRLG